MKLFTVQVVCGSFHSCIVTKDGDVYTWGRNLDGQLGNGTRQDGVISFNCLCCIFCEVNARGMSFEKNRHGTDFKSSIVQS